MSEVNESNLEELAQTNEIRIQKVLQANEEDCNVKIQDSGDEADISSEYVCDYSREESIKMPTVLEEDASNKSIKEFTFTYSNSEASRHSCNQSEYVGFEARKYGVYQTTPMDENEEQKIIIDEAVIHNPCNSDENLTHNSEYLVGKNYEINSTQKYKMFNNLGNDLNSECNDSEYKLNEDEVTVVRFTQDSIVQSASENFTGINESDQEEYVGRISTEFDAYDEEDSSRLREFELCKQELIATKECSPLECLKSSFISNFERNSNSKRNTNYVTSNFSPGLKFFKKTMSSFETQNFSNYCKSNVGLSNENISKGSPKIFSLKKCGRSKVGLTENSCILNLNNERKGRNKNKLCLVNLNSNLSVEKVVRNDQDKNSTDAEVGEENVEERPSDLYSSYRNVSVRAPRVISSLANSGVTQSRFSNTKKSCIYICDNEISEYKESIVSNDFCNFNDTQNNNFKLKQYVKGSRNYHTDYTNKDKENCDPQTTYQTYKGSACSISFGPKASNSKPRQK